jgi:hypothetical protein
MAKCKIIVVKSAKTPSITITQPSLNIGIGSTVFISPILTPVDLQVNYTSNNTTVASVSSSGEITAKSVGNASITITAVNNTSISRTIYVTVSNIKQAPIANAGLNQSVNEGTTVSLDASASSDPDGNPLTYKWTAPNGIILSSTTSAKPTFTAPEVKKDSVINFSLIVNDGLANSQPATVKITVLNVVKVGITDHKLKAFNIFPNPTTGIINLEISGETNHVVEISVYNMMGAEVFRRKTSNQERLQIDISNQVNGIYTLKVISGKQQFINKIILRKE